MRTMAAFIANGEFYYEKPVTEAFNDIEKALSMIGKIKRLIEKKT